MVRGVSVLIALLLVTAPGAGAAALRTPYLASDQTVFATVGWPARFEVLSTRPVPGGDLAAIGREAVCYLADHPDVKAGLVPFGGPVAVEFYQVTVAQLALGPQVLRVIAPARTVRLERVVCGEGA